MQIDARGVFTGFIIAPAIGAAVAVFGMMIHFVMTDPAGAELTVGELMPLAISIWFSALMFAYPAGLAFIALWLVLKATGLGSLASWVGGGLAGFAAMGAYLHRLHGGSVSSALAGGQDISTLTLSQLPATFALPLIGAGSGIIAALLFAIFARR
ncbi:hypothetical protein NHF40_03095 [Maricaulaceae bacterium EIL42A08]|nr:hypothetical protein [Maricaulaceae bacterium EIL42A08]